MHEAKTGYRRHERAQEVDSAVRLARASIATRSSVAVDGTVLAGNLEPRALQFVREWAGLHRQEILANWDRARKSEPLLDIPPLP